MAMIIDHFMWGYQPHFRINQKVAAEMVFRLLDRRFKPEIFLIGVLSEERSDRFPTCVEPEDDFWAKSEDFDEISKLAEKLLLGYPERQFFHTHPIAQQDHDEGLVKRSIKEAIYKIIDAHPSKPANLSYWAAFPVKVDCYWVSVVIGLQDDILESYYSLKKKEVKIHEYRAARVPMSLIDATILEFLTKASNELLKPDPGKWHNEINPEETLRSAANHMMIGVAWRVDQHRLEGMHLLSRACNIISSLQYEGIPGLGTILLARKDHPAIDREIEFATPAKLKNYRGARKLLELTSQELGLHSDPEEIFGLASIKEYNPENEDLFEVKIPGQHHWELVHAGQTLMYMEFGQPYLSKKTFDEQKLRVDLPRIFNTISDEQVERLINLVKQAIQAKHGTLLVISENAEQEAKRLSTQGTPLVPCTLTPHLLRHLTPIDGAIILSPDATCHAIGTILDGRASELGDPSRGARFNSAIWYVETSTFPCLAVVVSEDGGVDLVPDPQPAIRRSDIENAISSLKGISGSEAINIRKYNEVLDWLGKHHFYLLSEHCDVINDLIADIEAKLDAPEPRELRLVRTPFAPHPGMDVALYYLPE